MKQMSRRAARCFCMVRVSGVCFVVFWGFVLSGRGQTEWPEGKGKDIVQSVCSQCHGLRDVTSSKMTPEDWQNTVYDMVARGAPLFEEEMDVVVEYLSQNFGKAKAEKVNVNKTTAKELEASLNLTAKEAEEVVRYREQNGNFSKWEDLQRVPGLDAKKVEAVKDRLFF